MDIKFDKDEVQYLQQIEEEAVVVVEDSPEASDGGSVDATSPIFIPDVGAHFSTFLALSFAAIPSLETIQIDIVSENRQDTFSRTGWWF